MILVVFILFHNWSIYLKVKIMDSDSPKNVCMIEEMRSMMFFEFKGKFKAKQNEVLEKKKFEKKSSKSLDDHKFLGWEQFNHE